MNPVTQVVTTCVALAMLGVGCATPQQTMRAAIDAGRYKEASAVARTSQQPTEPFRYAIDSGNLAAARYYLGEGADPNTADTAVNIAGAVSKESNGLYLYKVALVRSTPVLKRALKSGNEAMVRLLISRGANPELEYVESDMQPLGGRFGEGPESFVVSALERAIRNNLEGGGVSMSVNGQPIEIVARNGRIESPFPPIAAKTTSVRKQAGGDPKTLLWLAK